MSHFISLSCNLYRSNRLHESGSEDKCIPNKKILIINFPSIQNQVDKNSLEINEGLLHITYVGKYCDNISHREQRLFHKLCRNLLKNIIP